MNKMCPNCGVMVGDNARSCHNCGVKFVQKVVPKDNNNEDSPRKTNGFAITALVLGICNLFCCGFLSTPGIIFGIIGMVQTKSNNEDGWGLALAGLIISAVSIIFLFIFLFITEMFYWNEVFYYW